MVINESLGHDVLVYPKPASQYLTIESSAAISQLEILNAGGQLLITHGVNNAKSVNLLVNELSTGIYILRLHTVKGVIVRKLSIE